MSAIECKLLLCSNAAKSASEDSTLVIDDLKDDKYLAEKVIKAQTRYVEKMHNILSGLTKDA